MLHSPKMQWIAHDEEQVGLKTALVMVKIQAAALAAVQFRDEHLARWHIEFGDGKRRFKFIEIRHREQQHQVDVVGGSDFAVDSRRDRSRHAVWKASALQWLEEIAKRIR